MSDQKTMERKETSKKLSRHSKMKEEALTEDSLREDSLEMPLQNVMLNDPVVTHQSATQEYLHRQVRREKGDSEVQLQ